MIPLSAVNTGEEFKIIKIYGGRGIMKKFFDMGINPNSLCKVISNPGKGPVIIEKDGIRVGIGYGMAKKIFVQIYNEGDFKNEKRD